MTFRGRRIPLPVVLLAVVAFPFALALGREFIAAGRCVDRGGMYDYLRALCYMSAEDVFEPKGAGPLVWVSAYVGLKLAAVLALAILPWRVTVPPTWTAFWKRRLGSFAWMR